MVTSTASAVADTFSSSRKTTEITIIKPKLDGIRLTATGKAKSNMNKKHKQQHFSAATKRATKMYYEETKKGKERKSLAQVSEINTKQFDGVGPSA